MVHGSPNIRLEATVKLERQEKYSRRDEKRILRGHLSTGLPEIPDDLIGQAAVRVTFKVIDDANEVILEYDTAKT